jgi:hypothetical protein
VVKEFDSKSNGLARAGSNPAVVDNFLVKKWIDSRIRLGANLNILG